MNKVKKQLEDYKRWVTTQDWYDENNEPYTIIKNPPSLDEIRALENKFGELPKSYLKLLDEFGLSEFKCDIYTSRMLSPHEILILYEIVQDEMDFNDGLRDEILEEDNLDFSKLLPVMAGKGLDGCWALLDLNVESRGRIIYWDTDQAGDLDCIYKNLEEFIFDSFIRAKTNNPLHLTNNVECLIIEPNRPKNVPIDAIWEWKEKEWFLGKKNDKGKMVGECKWYQYPTGHLICIAFFEGETGGTYKYKRFHPDNTISSSGSFLNNLHHGKFIIAKSKKPTTEKFMPSNPKINCWKVITICENGKTIEERYFDEDDVECYKPFKI